MSKAKDLSVGRKEVLINNSKSFVCTHAFRCLQALLVSVGYLIQNSLVKVRKNKALFYCCLLFSCIMNLLKYT